MCTHAKLVLSSKYTSGIRRVCPCVYLKYTIAYILLHHCHMQLLKMVVVYCDVTPKLAVHFSYQHCVEMIEYHASDGKPSLLIVSSISLGR